MTPWTDSVIRTTLAIRSGTKLAQAFRVSSRTRGVHGMVELQHPGRRFPRAIATALCLALAACNNGSSSGTGIRNLGISAFEMAGKDELWALRVFEANETADL